MSGICGILNLTGHDVPRALLTTMAGLMEYRGRDGTAHHFDGRICLGQASTHTTTQSRLVSLPLSDEETDVTLVMDGRIDNWQVLSQSLRDKGARLPDGSDATLVLKAYSIWGEACFEHIEGEFAIALWDGRKKCLICAVDRTSKKPFYYNSDGKHFAFASDKSALLCLPWVSQSLDLDYMAERLADNNQTLTQTCWDGIYKVVQAHYMVVQQSGITTKRYWFPENISPIRYKRAQDYDCLLYTSPSPRDRQKSRMPSSA